MNIMKAAIYTGIEQINNPRGGIHPARSGIRRD